MNFCHYNSCLLIKEKRILKKKGIKKAVFLNPLMLIPLPFDGNKMVGVIKMVLIDQTHFICFYRFGIRTNAFVHNLGGLYINVHAIVIKGVVIT